MHYSFSLQTLHNTIAIIMDTNLPEMANQDIHICLAALFISHKLHERDCVSIDQLCDEPGQSKKVLAMERLILRETKYKVAHPLLIDYCL